MSSRYHLPLSFTVIAIFVCPGCGKPDIKPLSSATPDPNGPLVPVLGSRNQVETTTDDTKQSRNRNNEPEK